VLAPPPIGSDGGNGGEGASLRAEVFVESAELHARTTSGRKTHAKFRTAVTHAMARASFAVCANRSGGAAVFRSKRNATVSHSRSVRAIAFIRVRAHG
jgi:hypothetical protein